MFSFENENEALRAALGQNAPQFRGSMNSAEMVDELVKAIVVLSQEVKRLESRVNNLQWSQNA